MTLAREAGALALAIYLLAGSGLACAEEDTTLTVTIEGLESRLRDNAAAYLEINQLAGKPVASESRLRWLHQRARDDIRHALEPFGFYKPTIDADLTQTASGWRANYKVDPGPPLRVTKLDLQVLGEGAKDPAFKQSLDKLPLARGQVFEHSRYEKIKQTLQGLATERGYFNARMLVNEIRVNPTTYTAEVTLHFDTGNRYHFGPINFHQNALAPELLRRYLDSQTGDPYEVATLLKLQSDLINSDYFNQVEVDGDPDKAVDQSIPVDVKLQPNKARKYTLGLGYGTDTGVRAKLGMQGRWINRWGHRYDTELLASQIQYGIAGKYIIPGKDPRTDSFALDANLLKQSISTQESLSAAIGFSKQYQRGSWLKISSLRYQRETFDFSSTPQQTTGLLIPSLNWTYVNVNADERLHPADGGRFNLVLQGALQPLLSDMSFLQVAVGGKWIKTLSPKGRLILRGNSGTTATSDFDKLPATLRFYAGGDNSVRGYSFDSIGPKNAQGDVIGGKNLLVASAEYEHRLWDKWSIAGFVDSGDAFDQGKPQLKTGVGFGLHWLSPVGPVRVDLASGLNRPPGDSIRLHLTIGPDL